MPHFFLPSIWVTKLILEYHWKRERKTSKHYTREFIRECQLNTSANTHTCEKKSSKNRLVSLEQNSQRATKKPLTANWIQCVNKCNNIIICVWAYVLKWWWFFCALLRAFITLRFSRECFFRSLGCCCSEWMSEREQEWQWLFRMALWNLFIYSKWIS